MLYWGIDHSPTLFRFPKRRGPRFLWWHNGARIELTQDPADSFRPSSLSLSLIQRRPVGGRTLHVFSGHSGPVTCLGVDNDVRMLLVPNFRLFQSITDATIRAFFTSVCQEISAFPEYFPFFLSSLDALFQFRVPGNFLCSGIYSFVRSSLDYAVGTQRSAFFQLVAGTRWFNPVASDSFSWFLALYKLVCMYEWEVWASSTTSGCWWPGPRTARCAAGDWIHWRLGV